MAPSAFASQMGAMWTSGRWTSDRNDAGISAMCDALPAVAFRLPTGTKVVAMWPRRPSRNKGGRQRISPLRSLLAIHRGDWVDPELGRITFACYAELWLAQRTDIRARTKEYYDWLITNRLVPTFGQWELGKITPAYGRSWYADLAGQTPGVSPLCLPPA